MKHRTLFGLALLVVAGIAISGHPAARQEISKESLKVQYNLSGPLKDIENKELVVVFSEDMIALGSNPDGAAFLKLAPACAGKYTWRGTKTLAFRPEGRFRYSTRYQAVIPDAVRSLNGKKLDKAVGWDFTTPLPEPREFRPSSKKYFDDINHEDRYSDLVWVTGSWFLRFNQAVTADEVRRVLMVAEKESRRPAAFSVISADDSVVEIIFAAPLRREMEYELRLSRGLRGKEGNTGTAKDFAFFASTIPPFRLETDKDISMGCDEPNLRLKFSNALSAEDRHEKNWRQSLRLEVERKGNRLPLSFDLSVSYDILVISIKDSLYPGDLLCLKLPGDLFNIYGETLGPMPEMKVKVCSAAHPFLTAVLESEPALLSFKSIREAEVSLFKFSGDLLFELSDRDERHYGYGRDEGHFGFLSQTVLPKKLLERRAAVSLEGKDANETLTRKLNLEKELGDKNGFFGVLTERALPFNSCGDWKLYHFPLFEPFTLQVVHRRSGDFLVRSGPGQMLLWAYDNRSGAGVEGGDVKLRRGGQDIAIGATGKDGLLRSASEIKQGDTIIVRRYGKSDLAFKRVTFDPLDRRPDFRAELFTDRDFYRPGDEVHIGGVVREYRQGGLTPAGLKQVTLELVDPEGQSVHTRLLNLDDWGGFYAFFPSKADAKKGRYTVIIKGGGLYQSRSIRIDYYQPNVFEVTIGKTQAVYARADVFVAAVSGAYFSGNPMAGDKLAYGLSTSAWPDLSRLGSKEDLSGFRFDLHEHFRLADPEYKREVVFDRSGAFAVSVPLKHFSRLNHAAGLHFAATAKSAEGKEYTTSSSALILPGRRICGLKMPFYANAKNEIKTQMLLLDNKGSAAAGTVLVSLYKQRWESRRWRIDLVQEGITLKVAVGKREYAFRVPEPGNYILKADARDEQGNVTSSSCGLLAWDYGWGSGAEDLELRSESEVCRIGDALTCYLQSPREGQALVTIETDRVLDAWTIDVQKTTPIELKVKKEHFPRFTVHVGMFLGGSRWEESRREFRVEDAARRLNVRIDAPAEVKPASRQSVKVRVVDNTDQARKAKIYVYAVDEGNLSLTGYRTPDWHDSLYYRSPLNRTRNLFSKDSGRWIFHRPWMDIALVGAGIFGCAMMPDGTPVADAVVTLRKKKSDQVFKAKTSSAGYYFFPNLKAADYEVLAEKGDLSSITLPVSYGGHRETCDLILLPRGTFRDLGVAGEVAGGVEGGVVGGVLGGVVAAAPMAPAQARTRMSEMKGEEEKADVSGIRVRSDFREVLFFKLVETDERGEAAVDFETSDQLSTYRLMAVAYNEDSYGSAEKRMLVSKDLLLAEAMPEFARSGDAFAAGVQVSNRTKAALEVKVVAESQGISISGDKQKRLTMDAVSNLLVPFAFRADAPAAAEIRFYALSAADKDGLLKKLPILDNLVSESQLDFDSGSQLTKRIHPPEGAEQPLLKLAVAPSILKPVGKIAEKLIFYPYECLEQRTSKLMPYLLLTPDLMARMDLKVDTAQVRQAVQEYIRVLPEFLAADGGLSYYRGSSWSSDYLTAYAIWALQLARRADYRVEQSVLSNLENHLAQTRLSPYCAAFYQFILSQDKRADPKELVRLYEIRDKLSIPGQVFLYRALGFQLQDRERQSVLAREFANGLQVEADFAYFDAKEFAYDRDLPFYSSRYGTALLLQALLEWQDDFVLAPRVMNWLLEAPPYAWHTTQTNFWILYAASEYVKKIEKGGATQARAELLGQVEEKKFAGPRDTWKIEKDISAQKDDFDVKVSGDQMIYLTSELKYKLRLPGAESRGITVARNVYGEDGKPAASFKKGETYMVELLLDLDKEVPYAVVDEPLAAGFEVLRQDIATMRELKEFSRGYAIEYREAWLRRENAADRTVFYTYGLQGKIRVVYFIKAMYAGVFTWLPAVVQGMYHPQYFGRCPTRAVTVTD